MVETDDELERIRKKKAEDLTTEIDKLKNWPDSPVEINDDNFRDIAARYPLVLLDMWAPWCGPCKMMAPVLEKFAKDHKGKVLVAKMNVDENPTTSRMFKVMSIPTLLVIKEREMVDRMTGAIPMATLVQKMEPHLEIYK